MRCVVHAMDWLPPRVYSSLLPNACWDQAPAPLLPWMDGCVVTHTSLQVHMHIQGLFSGFREFLVNYSLKTKTQPNYVALQLPQVIQYTWVM